MGQMDEGQARLLSDLVASRNRGGPGRRDLIAVWSNSLKAEIREACPKIESARERFSHGRVKSSPPPELILEIYNNGESPGWLHHPCYI
jgi:hypothetical protein